MFGLKLKILRKISESPKIIRDISRNPKLIKDISKTLLLTPLRLRPRLIKRMSRTAGLSPGTLVHVGKRKVEKTRITILDYGEKRFEEKEVKRVEECFPFKDKPTITWINIDGLHEVEVIRKIGKHFNLHPLMLEDIVNTGQRPKVEEFDGYILIVLKMIYLAEKTDQVIAEQISLVLGPNFVISFQETMGDIFNPIRERIRNNRGNHRKAGADYLAYSLIDMIVDNYFHILEKFGEKIEVIEEQLMATPTQETMKSIHSLKREIILLRRSVWPLRDLVNVIERSDSKLINKKTKIYLRDVYDHSIQVMDTVETFRDMLSGMLDLYLSSISNKMNEIMKVLTIITTIFIPLSFLAGIYGMNFEFMPELEWRWGYHMVWAVMIVSAISMVIYFRKKGWM